METSIHASMNIDLSTLGDGTRQGHDLVNQLIKRHGAKLQFPLSRLDACQNKNLVDQFEQMLATVLDMAHGDLLLLYSP
ncbi:hypothetical protein Thiowin_01755 [Thiorhodovibrio winogradskyi]|uniref:Uncharacterized protein n=1 Tax=Thiorhodovibrio winogradskyi TaxID=77007 RepID=A0ABZ0S9N5_9GAMM|nr:hypothetical protein [Thiorhodovibrio winogradskyi]